MQQTTASIQHDQQVLLEQRDDIAQKTAATVQQTKSAAATLDQLNATKAAKAADVQRLTEAVTSARAAALPMQQRAAASQAVVTLVAAAKALPSADAIPPLLAPKVEDVASQMRALDKKAETWSQPRVTALIHSLTYRVGPEIRVAIGRYYEKTAAYLAKIDPTKYKDKMVYAGRLRTLQRCLDRAQDAIFQYKDHLRQNNLTPLSSTPLDLPHLVSASEVLALDTRDLAAALTEVQANHCDVMGMDQALQITLADADQWQDWLDRKRIALTTSASN